LIPTPIGTCRPVPALVIVGVIPEGTVLAGRPGLDGRRVPAQRHRVGISGGSRLRVPVWGLRGQTAAEHGQFSIHFVVVPSAKRKNAILKNNDEVASGRIE